MNAETLLSLAERVEQASGPDREIDLEIMRYAMNIGGPAETAAIYTASLDAAMTLFDINAAGRRIETQSTDAGAWVRLTWMQNGFSPMTEGRAVKLQLALCAAALRARAAPNPSGEGVNHE